MATLTGLEAAERLPGPGGRREVARFELYCSSCGYGVVVRMAPEICPMCRRSVWEHPAGATRPV